MTEPSASATSSPSALTSPTSTSPPRRGALAVIATATLLVVLDSTIVNVALPTIRSRLGFSPTGLEWVITAYSLAFGGLLLLGGRSGDLFGRRRMLVTGLTLFSLASLTAGLAPDPAVLIAARFAQGAGAAIAAPTALSLIAITFPAGPARNRAMSVYAAMSSTGGALGLILGGVLTQYANWRWVFLVAVPIGLTAAAGAGLVLPETPAARRSPDLPGALTATAGLAALVYGLSRASDGTWSSPATIGPLTAAAMLLPLFAAAPAHAGSPPRPPPPPVTPAWSARLPCSAWAWAWPSSRSPSPHCRASNPPTPESPQRWSPPASKSVPPSAWPPSALSRSASPAIARPHPPPL